MKKFLFTDTEWTFSSIDDTWGIIRNIGEKQLDLKGYDVQLEIISSQQMLDAYCSVAMPISYAHWSFGKQFIMQEHNYLAGKQGLAYEVVINTDPSIAYLAENNSMAMQTLVMAHASIGHNYFFKHNYCFKTWTMAESILNVLKYARSYITQCENQYGISAVEAIVDACHMLRLNSIDKYQKPRFTEERKKQQEIERADYEEQRYNVLYPQPSIISDHLQEKEENLLYYIEENSPSLLTWQKEICQLIRKIAQYFYPQMLTSVMNEGFACLIHYHIMQMMHKQGYITNSAYMEMLHMHTNVVYQPAGPINIYALGYAMMTDIKRMCISPDAEDIAYFPNIVNTNWLDTIKNIVANYRDESFILQFLSPKILRKFKLFSIDANYHIDNTKGFVECTHESEDVVQFRKILAAKYTPHIPNIEIIKRDNKVELSHKVYNNNTLDEDCSKKVMKAIRMLWKNSNVNMIEDKYDRV